MTTIADLVEEVKDNVVREGVKDSPNKSTLVRAINRGKNDVVAFMEQSDPLAFVAQLDYLVVAGDPSIDLPGFGTVPDEARWRSIYRITTIVGGLEHEAPVFVYDRRDTGVRAAPRGWWMYREANKLFFNAPEGAPGSFTLRLRYAAAVADINAADLSAEYALIPEEWLDLVVIRATLDLIPGGGAGRFKWERRWTERLDLMQRTGTRRIHQGPVSIRPVDDGW